VLLYYLASYRASTVGPRHKLFNFFSFAISLKVQKYKLEIEIYEGKLADQLFTACSELYPYNKSQVGDFYVLCVYTAIRTEERPLMSHASRQIMPRWIRGVKTRHITKGYLKKAGHNETINGNP
jgi:hypothetical protein